MTMKSQDIPHPIKTNGSVKSFASREEAWRHLRDHVLSYPECLGWALLLENEGVSLPLDLRSKDLRWDFVRYASEHEDGSVQPLFDRYCGAISRASKQAGKLGWYVDRGPRGPVVAIGLDGLLFMIERGAVTTAYLPGAGSAVKVVESKQGNIKDSERNIPRETDREAARQWRGKKWNRSERDVSQSIRCMKYELRWDEEEKLYYRVFRPALQRIRQRQYDGGPARWKWRDEAALKAVLPMMSKLKLPQWRELRSDLESRRNS